MGIVTKTGDEGRTKLLSGEDVSKADPRVEVYGTADELVSHLGVARSLIEDRALAKEVRNLQMDLMRFIGELAVTDPKKHEWVEVTVEKHVTGLEDKIGELEEGIELPRAFIITGGSRVSAALDVARTIARRMERRLIKLADDGIYGNLHGLKYANRLSDYLFLLARSVECAEGIAFDVGG